jgi:hypothetical protein
VALALDAPTYTAAPTRPMLRTGVFAVPALASLGAGAIHAAAIGAHGEHRQAVITFAIVAAAQLALGGAALVSNRKAVGIAMAVVNFALLVGWAMAKRSGISFIDGMEEAEAVQWADGLAAGMAAASVIGVAFAAMRGWRIPASDALVRVLAVPMVVLTVTGMVAAGGHAHAGGHDEMAGGHDHAATASDGSAEVHAAQAVAPKPYIPGQPIDLGGVPGVTPTQQAAAEDLVSRTLYYLPHFADFRVAESEGWFSIGDGATGHEHFINPSKFSDGTILDPTVPEAIVYFNENGVRTLGGAMYMLETGTTLDDVPELGGPLTQWHIHDNLCFTQSGRVAGLRAPGGPCQPPLVKGGETPMIHVWVTSNKCGPFAALEGIGGGTVAEGEDVLCDTAHGH